MWKTELTGNLIRGRSWARRWGGFGLLLALGFAVLAMPAPARPEVQGVGALTPTEKWVLEKIVAGEVADLKEKFGGEVEARQVRGRFMEALLTDGIPGFKPHRSGIYLVNAVIPDLLSLEFATVPHAVFFVGCRFQGPVNFAGCEFKKSLSLPQAFFAQAANFYRLKVGLDVSLRQAVFAGPVDFGGFAVDGQFMLAGARFTDKVHEANFNGGVVGQSLSLKNAVFEGPVDFTGVKAGGEFNAAAAQFTDAAHKSHFQQFEGGAECLIRESRL